MVAATCSTLEMAATLVGGGVGYYNYRQSYYFATPTTTTPAANYDVGGFGGDGVVIVQYARLL